MGKEKNFTELTRARLAYVNISMLVFSLVFIFLVEITEDKREILMFLLGAIIVNMKDSQSFFFGTSQSSADKNKIINNSNYDNEYVEEPNNISDIDLEHKYKEYKE